VFKQAYNYDNGIDDLAKASDVVKLATSDSSFSTKIDGASVEGGGTGIERRVVCNILCHLSDWSRHSADEASFGRS
jgi:hypothetical protein